MYQNILFPVDVTEPSSWQASLSVAIEYARQFKATLHVLTIVPDLGMSIVAQYFPSNAEAKMIEETTAALHEFTAKHLPKDIAFRHIVAKGAVYQGVINTAEEIDADLILMEAHRPELKDYLLGPNAAKVVRHSKRSVLVVRAPN
ncbi:MAG: universal stress protein [Alphaproteobacteria bacterium]|nr:universal stress protein [Alphaproteobacteria bacterium]